MSIKKTTSLIISLLLLINPLAGVLAENVGEEGIDSGITVTENGTDVTEQVTSKAPVKGVEIVDADGGDYEISGTTDEAAVTGDTGIYVENLSDDSVTVTSDVNVETGDVGVEINNNVYVYQSDDEQQNENAEGNVNEENTPPETTVTENGTITVTSPDSSYGHPAMGVDLNANVYANGEGESVSAENTSVNTIDVGDVTVIATDDSPETTDNNYSPDSKYAYGINVKSDSTAYADANNNKENEVTVETINSTQNTVNADTVTVTAEGPYATAYGISVSSGVDARSNSAWDYDAEKWVDNANATAINEANNTIETGDVNVEAIATEYNAKATGISIISQELEVDDGKVGNADSQNKSNNTVTTGTVSVTATNDKGGKYSSNNPDAIGVRVYAQGEVTDTINVDGITVTTTNTSSYTDADGANLRANDKVVVTLDVHGNVVVTANSTTDEREKERGTQSGGYQPQYTSVNTIEDYNMHNNGVNIELKDGTVTADVEGTITVNSLIDGEEDQRVTGAGGISIEAGTFGEKEVYVYRNQNGEEIQVNAYDQDTKIYYSNIGDKVGYYDWENGGVFVEVGEFVARKLIENNDTGHGNVAVTAENIETTGAGIVIAYATDDTDTKTDIVIGTNDPVIDGVVDAGLAPILVNNHVTEDSNVSITVWELTPVKVGDEEHAVATLENGELATNETTEAIEKKINYIIKVEQPDEGATLKATDENGTEVETANETDKVILKVEVMDGYTLTGAFNGNQEKVELLRDGNGNYYVVVPRGGGVYLTATVSRNSSGDDSGTAENETPVIVTSVVAQFTDGASNETTIGVSPEDAKTISRYSAEQQVAIILTTLGLEDALNSSGIHMKDLAIKAASGITSDLSSLLVEEELTIDGVTAVWQVIEVVENGKRVKYCFRQLEDGTWVSKKIVAE